MDANCASGMHLRVFGRFPEVLAQAENGNKPKSGASGYQSGGAGDVRNPPSRGPAAQHVIDVHENFEHPQRSLVLWSCAVELGPLDESPDATTCSGRNFRFTVRRMVRHCGAAPVSMTRFPEISCDQKTNHEFPQPRTICIRALRFGLGDIEWRGLRWLCGPTGTGGRRSVTGWWLGGGRGYTLGCWPRTRRWYFSRWWDFERRGCGHRWWPFTGWRTLPGRR